MEKENSLLYRWINTEKKSMKLPVLIAFLGILAAIAIPAFAGGPPPQERTWGNDLQYLMLTPKVPVPANTSAQEDLYVIAPVDPSNPQSPGHDGLIGPHDHVIPIPPGNHGTFSAVWHAILIVPGPNAIPGTNVLTRTITPPTGGIDLVYAADLGSGLVNLTSVEKIEKAEALGLVKEVPTPVVFVCAIVKVGLV